MKPNGLLNEEQQMANTKCPLKWCVFSQQKSQCEQGMMAEPITGTRSNMAVSNDENRLKFASDTGILSDEGTTEDNHDLDSEDSNDPPSPDSESSDSPRMDDLAASLRVFSNSLARMEVEETEMIRVRETLRWEAEKRRMEMESELARMVLATELQMASVAASKGPSRKRKRVEENEDESAISRREEALLLCLLQCNFLF